jgi:choline/glycine/proline betaine transport protein
MNHDDSAGHKQTSSDSLPDHNARTIEPTIFWCSAILITVFVLLSFGYSKELSDTFGTAQKLFSTYTGWFYIIGVNIFLVFALWLLFSRYGDIRIGGSKAKPEFSGWSWFSMLFSAGMGIGLVFWSVAEPMYHFSSPPLGAEPNTIASAKQAMTITLFHWGLHAWGIYAVIGLALAFFSYNRGLPLTIRSAFYPLLGEKIYGPLGHTIDILAVVATMFGLATSLGLGVQQVNAGLSRLFDVEISTWMQIGLIAFITGIAVISVVSGLDKGVRRLSEMNMYLAGSLLLFVCIAGPTVFLLDSVIQNLGAYLQRLLQLSTWTESYQQTQWQHGWTIFYWAWWIAWSPFVGMFIARVSKGRTVREFIFGVLMVPTLMTTLWITVFGGTAIHMELNGDAGILAAVNENVATALYAMFEVLPWSQITSAVAVVVVITFFVTSSDSGSLVIDTITSGGHPNPPVAQKVFWASAEGFVAAALLFAGGLSALQAGSILTGLPFTIVLIVMCVSLAKGLKEEWINELREEVKGHSLGHSDGKL